MFLTLVILVNTWNYHLMFLVLLLNFILILSRVIFWHHLWRKKNSIYLFIIIVFYNILIKF